MKRSFTLLQSAGTAVLQLKHFFTFSVSRLVKLLLRFPFHSKELNGETLNR